MLKKLINLFAPKWLKNGFAAVQKFFDGKKTYIGGSALMLSAITMFIEQFTELKGLGGLLEWFKGMPTNVAFIQFNAALGIMGLRAGVLKIKKDNG